MKQKETMKDSEFRLDIWNVALYAVPNLPLIQVGDDIGQLTYEKASEDGFSFQDGDVVVIAQKIVSKAEDAVVSLASVTPSSQAYQLAQATGRDPRLCEVYIQESKEILGTKGRMVITRHRLGFESTSAGVDRSNIAPASEGVVTLLPQDPDASARRIRDRFRELTNRELAVIISDSFGRHDREGAYGVAIGIAGIRHLEQYEKPDLFGNPGRPEIALVDELASAASIIMGQTSERRPVVIIRGVSYTQDESAAIRRLLIL
jgi:coenzyme F420-0:L-glutamate ligase/coenzyme F420-1:gamma-L-glutamate ligase